nr:hypothetical protein CFP56_51366 [Quercus suber]
MKRATSTRNQLQEAINAVRTIVRDLVPVQPPKRLRISIHVVEPDEVSSSGEEEGIGFDTGPLLALLGLQLRHHPFIAFDHLIHHSEPARDGMSPVPGLRPVFLGRIAPIDPILIRLLRLQAGHFMAQLLDQSL